MFNYFYRTIGTKYGRQLKNCNVFLVDEVTQ